MSARDAESGSSTYKGGSGRAGGLGNGGIGGGMGGGGNWGGGMGGGAGRNGGIGNMTGLMTGNRMIGGMAFGRPGRAAMNPGAWGIQPQPPIYHGPLAGQPRAPVPASAPPVASSPVKENILAVEDVPPPPPQMPSVMYQPWNNQLVDFVAAMKANYGQPSYSAPAPVQTKQFYDQVPQDPNWRAPTIPAGMGFQLGSGSSPWGRTESAPGGGNYGGGGGW